MFKPDFNILMMGIRGITAYGDAVHDLTYFTGGIHKDRKPVTQSVVELVMITAELVRKIKARALLA